MNGQGSRPTNLTQGRRKEINKAMECGLEILRGSGIDSTVPPGSGCGGKTENSMIVWKSLEDAN